MSGRKKFAVMKPALILVSLFYSIFPRAMRRVFWRMTDFFPGLIGNGLRWSLLRTLVQKCGDSVFIGTHVELVHPERLVLGDRVSIHKGCYVDAFGGIEIGSDVSIAQGSSLISFEHTWDDASTPIKYNPSRGAKITIRDDVWVGCGVRILSGVTIQSRSVAAAGAVVTKDVEHGSLVGGVPAKLLKKISEESRYP